MLVHIFYYNTPVNREILLQFFQFTEKYYIKRTPFHFRPRAKTMLKRVARLLKAFSRARPSTLNKRFYTSIWAVQHEKILARLSIARSPQNVIPTCLVLSEYSMRFCLISEIIHRRQLIFNDASGVEYYITDGE